MNQKPREDAIPTSELLEMSQAANKLALLEETIPNQPERAIKAPEMLDNIGLDQDTPVAGISSHIVADPDLEEDVSPNTLTSNQKRIMLPQKLCNVVPKLPKNNKICPEILKLIEALGPDSASSDEGDGYQEVESDKSKESKDFAKHLDDLLDISDESITLTKGKGKASTIKRVQIPSGKRKEKRIESEIQLSDKADDSRSQLNPPNCCR